MSAPKPPGYLPSFCLHFLLPNALLGVLALSAGAIGAEYGVQYLIWHDDPVKQYWVGFALALVALQALFIGMLLWGKKAGSPDRLQKFPELIHTVNSCIFGKYCSWVVGQLIVLVVALAAIVLLVQFIDTHVQGSQTKADVETQDANAQIPPAPNYGPWLPLGGLTATIAVFFGGWLAKHAIALVSTPSAPGVPRRLMAWLIDAADQQLPTPDRGGLLLALWSARSQGSRMGRVWVALFNQTLCLSIGVVFAAVWDLSKFFIALGISSFMLLGLVAVRTRWLNDARVFRVFILLLGCLCYFVITWLGSRPWCGWPGAFAVAVFLAAVLPIGFHYAFPGATAQLLRTTNERMIDPQLCRRYPFHSVAVVFFLFGVASLFVVPNVVQDFQSPMVLGCFLAFMFLAGYGFVAYVIDDALPYLVPALLVMVVLSGLPGYKMQFPGLEYAGRPADGVPAPLLDLQAAVEEDNIRRKEFDRAQAREMDAPWVALVAGGPAKGAAIRPNEEADRLWVKLEEKNKVLPGKTTRPGTGQPSNAKLLALSDVAFRSVPLSTEEKSIAKPTGKKPMILIVASGGGIRAAAWTFLVMSELEARFAEEGIPFPYHVRLITGASGGMLGASYYVRSLKAPDAMHWGDNRRAEMVGPGGRFDKLTQDWLTPIVERLVTNDVPGFFSPFASPTDRGVALEQAWSKKLDGELDMSFEKISEREQAGWCPSIVFSPMMIEDGRRLLISNLDMRYPVSNDGHLLDYEQTGPGADLNRNYSHEALELFRLFPQMHERFAISTAIRMSASFPFLSPAVSLPTKPRRRVVDAGYFDNYGVSLAAAFLFSGKNREWFQENVSKIAIVQIRDGASDDERRLEVIPDAKRKKGIDSLLSRSLEEFTSPLEGMSSGRVGTCSFRNDALLELLSSYFESQRREPGSGKIPQAQRYFTVVNFEFPNQVSLSWHLSKGEKAQMRKPFEDVDTDAASTLQSRIAALIEWWKADVYEAPADEPRTRVAGRP